MKFHGLVRFYSYINSLYVFCKRHLQSTRVGENRVHLKHIRTEFRNLLPSFTEKWLSLIVSLYSLPLNLSKLDVYLLQISLLAFHFAIFLVYISRTLAHFSLKFWSLPDIIIEERVLMYFWSAGKYYVCLLLQLSILNGRRAWIAICLKEVIYLLGTRFIVEIWYCFKICF